MCFPVSVALVSVRPSLWKRLHFMPFRRAASLESRSAKIASPEAETLCLGFAVRDAPSRGV